MYLMAVERKERVVMYKRNRYTDSSIYGVGMNKFIDKYLIKTVSISCPEKTTFDLYLENAHPRII